MDNPGHPLGRSSGWDSFNCGDFPAPGGVNSILRDHASHPPTLEPDWHQITVDFNHDTVDPVTNLPYFWCTEHPYCGIVACFLVTTDMHNIDKEIFRATLVTGQFNLMMQKWFRCNFPAYTSGMSMYTYISRIIRHGLLCKFYVPPLHTICYNHVYGAWASGPNFLLPHVWTDICSTMSGVLADCLQSKWANLVSVNKYGTIVCKNSDGYMSIFKLASYARHPHLSAYPKTIMMPVQQSNISLKDHILKWLKYLDAIALGSVFYSDQYFVEIFLSTINHLIRSQSELALVINVRAIPLNKPLPDIYGPCCITLHLLEYFNSRHCASTCITCTSALSEQPPHPSSYGPNPWGYCCRGTSLHVGCHCCSFMLCHNLFCVWQTSFLHGLPSS